MSDCMFIARVISKRQFDVATRISSLWDNDSADFCLSKHRIAPLSALIKQFENHGGVRSYDEVAAECATATLSFNKIASIMTRIGVVILCW